MTHRKPWLTAALVLATLAASASAAHAFTGMAISPGGRVEQPSEGMITFTSSTGITVRCNITFEFEMGTGPFTNRRGVEIGQTTGIGWTCEGEGELTSFLSGRWPIESENILEFGEATPPEVIAGLLVTLVEFTAQFTYAGLRCLYQGNLGMLFPLTRTGVIEEESRRFYRYSQGALRILDTIRLLRASGNMFCPASITARGTFRAAEPAQVYTFW